MNSAHVLYCNGVAKISHLEKHSAKMYTSKTIDNFQKFYNKFAQKFKNVSKFFQNKI